MNNGIVYDDAGQYLALRDGYFSDNKNGKLATDRWTNQLKADWDRWSGKQNKLGNQPLISDFVQQYGYGQQGADSGDEAGAYIGYGSQPQQAPAPVQSANPFEQPIQQTFTNLGEENGVVNPGLQDIGQNPFESPLYQGISNILNRPVETGKYHGFNFQNAYANPLYGNGINPTARNPFGKF